MRKHDDADEGVTTTLPRIAIPRYVPATAEVLERRRAARGGGLHSRGTWSVTILCGGADQTSPRRGSPLSAATPPLFVLDAIEPIRAKTRSRPRRRPHKLRADKGFD